MMSDPDLEALVRSQLRSELSGLPATVSGSTVRARLADRQRRRLPAAPWHRGLPVGLPQRATRLMVVLTLAAVLVAGTLTAGALTGLLRTNPPPVAPAGQAVGSASPSASRTQQPPPTAQPTPPATQRPRPSCPTTLPDPPFAAPSPYPSQPFSGRKEWYGSEALWTMLDPNGEVWSGLPAGSGGLTQKTFWFSNLMIPAQMTVSGERLDDPGSFTSDPGTNATSSDFGDAMLVGIEVPTPGCWQITGHYRGAELSYVVLVNGQ